MDMLPFRKAFINAIAHNDWTICEPTVYVFSDRIEVFPYGGLPYGQTEEMFFKGASNPKDASLMRILSDLEYVEQIGHGIPEIISHYGKEAFDTKEHYINAVIPFDKEAMESHAKMQLALNWHSIGTQPEFTEEELIKVIKTNDKITRKEIAAHFGISLRTVQRYLNTTESVRYVGSGKSGHRRKSKTKRRKQERRKFSKPLL